MKSGNFRVLILLSTVSAPVWAQHTFTASPISITGYKVAGLNWLSDDGKTGYGSGLSQSVFSTQCFSYSDGKTNPFLFPGTNCQPLAAAQGNFVFRTATDSNAGAINNVTTYQLFVYRNGQYNLLQPPDSVRFVPTPILSAVNANGQIATFFSCPAPAGAPFNSSVIPCAYSVSNTGVFTRLPDLGGAAYATAINNNGDIAGWSTTLNDFTQCCYASSSGSVILWSQGSMKTLTSAALLPGVPTSMNSKGQIVGGASANAQLTVAGPGYFYDGSTFNPVQVTGASKTVPAWINDIGEIVGNYESKDHSVHAFYYSNGVALDLNTLVTNLPANIVIVGASYIANTGQILVSSVDLSQSAGSVTNGLAALQYLLTPTGGTVSAPIVSGVVNGASFVAGTASSALVTIEGTALSSTTRTWSNSDFVNGSLPTSLDGVSVTIDGIHAYPTFISPTQINVVAPDDATTGSVQVQVTNSKGTSNAFMTMKSDVMPAFFMVGGRYAAALHANGSAVGPAGFLGANFVPATQGETIQLYGTGFGLTVPPSAAGQVVTQAVQLANPVTVTIGNVPAQVTYAGRTASGTDQLNVMVPISLFPDGDFSVVATVNGVKTPAVPISVKFQ
jgi:uncharacterized protein (TIGR03437 family)